MKFDLVIRYVGMVLLLDAGFMFIAAMISLFNGIDTGFYPLLVSFVITATVGAFPLIFVPRSAAINSKEGYLIVIISWLMSCLIGMLPYVIWGGEFTVADAWFESVSGFTTTGATTLRDVEALPRGLLFWRASTHWIGGVGVVLFALVVLPSMGRTKLTLSSVELSDLAKDNFRYNTRKVLRIITVVYIGLTTAEAILLMFAGMNWFDSVATSFSTIATGGFSTKNQSIMFFHSAWIEGIITVFMLAGAIHFGLIYATIKGKRNNIFRSEVTRYFLTCIFGAGILVAINLYTTGIADNFGEALRYGIFQVAAYGTTTGFASTNNAAWPGFAILLMIFVSIQCGCAGSTSGGVKADRVLLLFKSIRARIWKLQHPSAIFRMKLNGITQDDSAVSAANLLISFYLVVALVSTLLISLTNIDLLTSFSSSIACLSNVGPGFGMASNMENMDFFPVPVKFWLSIMMIFGRLELFGLIHLVLIRSWK